MGCFALKISSKYHEILLFWVFSALFAALEMVFYALPELLFVLNNFTGKNYETLFPGLVEDCTKYCVVNRGWGVPYGILRYPPPNESRR
jgi:hypothetical protein